MNLDFLTDKSKRKRSSQIWLALVVLWCLVRAFLVNIFFSPHGVNPFWYFAVDVLSSIPYGIFSARLVFAYIDKDSRHVFTNGFITLISFYLPDIYVFIFANEIPRILLYSFIAWIALFTLLGANEIRRKIGKEKSNRN